MIIAALFALCAAQTSRKLLYFHVPKCAGTTARLFLQHFGESRGIEYVDFHKNPDLDHETALQRSGDIIYHTHCLSPGVQYYADIRSRLTNTTLKFAMLIRDPIDMMLSWWLYLQSPRAFDNFTRHWSLHQVFPNDTIIAQQLINETHRITEELFNFAYDRDPVLIGFFNKTKGLCLATRPPETKSRVVDSRLMTKLNQTLKGITCMPRVHHALRILVNEIDFFHLIPGGIRHLQADVSTLFNSSSRITRTDSVENKAKAVSNIPLFQDIMKSVKQRLLSTLSENLLCEYAFFHRALIYMKTMTMV